MAKRSPTFQPKATPIRPKIPPTGQAGNGKPAPRLMPILIGGGLLYVTATYVSMVVFKSKTDTEKQHDEHHHHGIPTKTSSVTPGSYDTNPVWEKLARNYDKEIGSDEFVMGIGLMRRWLVGQAKGDVLEASTGTGRNFEYYKPEQVTSATFTDKSESMLSEAKSKFEQYKTKFQARFEQSNVDAQPMQKYDTVVDTFGLCSCGDPEEALISLAKACKPTEESRILLLEHGRSHYDWLNRILDSNVDKHVMRWGCWWNRDLMGLFEREKVKQHIEIVKVYRWHLGTTCYIVAKPRTPHKEQEN